MMSKDSMQVYCRLRPMQSPTDVSCMRVTSDTTVVITRPGSADDFHMTNKEIRMTFNHVFTSNATQGEIFETVALPLVENLIHGRNGLLFTYGVTGSGNTYTMTGERQDAGIMPQCLDVIFNTIANYQTEKFVSKPDKLNSFDEADAMLDRQHVLHAGPSQITGRLGERQKIDSDGDSNPTVAYERNESHSVVIEPDNAFAVIITFVEIYCSSVFDLLYEDDITSKHKIAIEDGNKNMYEDTFTEVEVKTAEEAFELFQRGQRKRRFAHTAHTSDAELSSSHSVFTIRLVQTLLNCESEHVMQDKRIACVSQLSLVDFVGYEDMAENYCLRWLEAENLHRSLTTLRSYLEILREDQDTNKMVSYEAFSFPSLFKGCFDGQEQVRMIVCVNPRANDYDNTIQIMEFAEMIQEMYIARYDLVKLDVGFTPGRRQAIKEARSKLEKGGRPKAADLDIGLGLVYKYFVTSSGGSFPQLKTIPLDDDQMIHLLIQFLKQRLSKPHILGADLQTKQEDFGRTLMAVEQENVNLEAANTQQKTKISALDGYKYDHLQSLKLQETMLITMQQLVRNRDLALNQRLIDKQRVKQKYNQGWEVTRYL